MLAHCSYKAITIKYLKLLLFFCSCPHPTSALQTIQFQMKFSWSSQLVFSLIQFLYRMESNHLFVLHSCCDGRILLSKCIFDAMDQFNEQENKDVMKVGIPHILLSRWIPQNHYSKQFLFIQKHSVWNIIRHVRLRDSAHLFTFTHIYWISKAPNRTFDVG